MATIPKKKKSSVNQGNILIEKLRTEVFDIPLLKQDKIFQLFVKADKTISPVVHLLLINSEIVRSHVYGTMLKVASSNTYGRNIFEKGGPDKELAEAEKKAKPILKKVEVEFLERAFGFMWACAREEKFKIPPAFEKAMFIRGIYEECINLFLDNVKGYKELNNQASRLIIERSYEPKLIDQYATILKKLRDTEKKIGIGDTNIYGLILMTEEVIQKFSALKEQILNPYLRIVYSTAKKCSKTKDQLLDNFQNGTLGLLRAVSCYSTKRPTTFSAVAKWWIRQMILLTIKEDANFVKLPISTWQAYTVLEKARAKLESQGKDTEKELSDLTKMPISKIRNVYDSVKVSQVYSLNRTFDDEDKLNLTGVLIDKDATAEDAIEEKVKSVFEIMKDIPKEVIISISLLYGAVDALPQTISLDDGEIYIEAIRQLCYKNYIQFIPNEAPTPHLRLVKYNPNPTL